MLCGTTISQGMAVKKMRSAIQIKMDWIERQPLRGSRKAVLRCLVDHANNKTNNCYPGQDRISGITGHSIKTVIRSIWVIKTVGIIRVERKTFNRQGRMGVKNTYTMQFGFVASEADVKAAERVVNDRRPKSPTGVLVDHDQSPPRDRPKSPTGTGTINKNSSACGDAVKLSIFRLLSDSCFGVARAAAYQGRWRNYGDGGEVIWELKNCHRKTPKLGAHP